MAQYLKSNLDPDLKFISLTLKYLQSYPKAYSNSYSSNGGKLRRLDDSTGNEFYYSLFGTAIFATSNSIDETLVTSVLEESFSAENEKSVLGYFKNSGMKDIQEVEYNPSSFEIPIGAISSEEINNETKASNKGVVAGMAAAVLALFGVTMFAGYFIYRRRNRSDRTAKTIEEFSQSPSKMGFGWNNQPSSKAADALRDAEIIQEVTVPHGSPSERPSNDTSTLSGYTYGYTVEGTEVASAVESSGQSTLFPVSVYGQREKDLFPEVDFDEVWDVGTFMDDGTMRSKGTKHSVAFGKDGKVYGVSVRDKAKEKAIC